jgi:hypothetical protein
MKDSLLREIERFHEKVENSDIPPNRRHDFGEISFILLLVLKEGIRIEGNLSYLERFLEKKKDRMGEFNELLEEGEDLIERVKSFLSL